MATISYAFVSRCEGGGHIALDVAVNGAEAKRIVYATDEVRAPLSLLTHEEREQLALLILKVHFAGMTRNQIAAEMQAGPVRVTI